MSVERLRRAPRGDDWLSVAGRAAPLTNANLTSVAFRNNTALNGQGHSLYVNVYVTTAAIALRNITLERVHSTGGQLIHVDTSSTVRDPLAWKQCPPGSLGEPSAWVFTDLYGSYPELKLKQLGDFDDLEMWLDKFHPA